jgi:hypothetical protein
MQTAVPSTGGGGAGWQSGSPPPSTIPCRRAGRRRQSPFQGTAAARSQSRSPRRGGRACGSDGCLSQASRDHGTHPTAEGQHGRQTGHPCNVRGERGIMVTGRRMLMMEMCWPWSHHDEKSRHGATERTHLGGSSVACSRLSSWRGTNISLMFPTKEWTVPIKSGPRRCCST